MDSLATRARKNKMKEQIPKENASSNSQLNVLIHKIFHCLSTNGRLREMALVPCPRGCCHGAI